MIAIRGLSVGEWMPHVGLVALTVMRGPHFRTVGLHSRIFNKTVLQPEEAVFLMDRGVLEVQYGEFSLPSPQRVHAPHRATSTSLITPAPLAIPSKGAHYTRRICGSCRRSSNVTPASLRLDTPSVIVGTARACRIPDATSSRLHSTGAQTRSGGTHERRCWFTSDICTCRDRYWR
jgi:hypothetical protein